MHRLECSAGKFPNKLPADSGQQKNHVNGFRRKQEHVRACCTTAGLDFGLTSIRPPLNRVFGFVCTQKSDSHDSNHIATPHRPSASTSSCCCVNPTLSSTTTKTRWNTTGARYHSSDTLGSKYGIQENGVPLRHNGGEALYWNTEHGGLSCGSCNTYIVVEYCCIMAT